MNARERPRKLMYAVQWVSRPLLVPRKSQTQANVPIVRSWCLRCLGGC